MTKLGLKILRLSSRGLLDRGEAADVGRGRGRQRRKKLLLGASSVVLLGLPLGWATPAIAGCSNATPASGTVVICDANAPNPDTQGVQAQAGSTNVTVTVDPGAGITHGFNGVVVYNQSTATNNGTIDITSPTGTAIQGMGLLGFGNNNVLTNNGTITSASQTNIAGGILVLGDNNLITNSAAGTMTTIGPDADGVRVDGSGNTVINDGTIVTTGNGNGLGGTTPVGITVFHGNNNTVTNNGVISTFGIWGVGIYGGGDTLALTNTGTITTTGDNGSGVYLQGNTSVVNNSGTITTAGVAAFGAVILGNANILTNAGTITTTAAATDGIIIFGDGNVVTNSRRIDASGVGSAGINAVSTAGQNTSIVNQAGGVISAPAGLAIAGGAGNETVDNAGSLIGNGVAVALGAGNDALTLHSTSVVQGAMDGGTGTDTLTFDNFAYTGGGGIQNWETFNISNGSRLTLNSDLVMGDLGGFAGDPNATKTGVVNIDSASVINAFGTYAIRAIDPASLVTVNNAGTLNLSNGSATNTLTIVGNYIGQNGRLILSTVLGSDNSPSDKLVISGGTATGNTSITVNNAGGGGALTTGDGIRVVQAINSATTGAGAFALSGRVAAGAYDYILYRSGATTPDDWYLRSTRVITPGPPIQPTPPSAPPPPEVPNYRLEVPLYMAIPDLAHQFGFAMIGSLHGRIGDDDPAVQPTPPAVPTTVWCKAPSKNFRCNVTPQQEGVYADANSAYARYGSWTRVFGETGRHREGSFWDGKGPDYDYGLAGIQAGLDVYRREHDDGSHDVAGFYVGGGRAEGDVNHIFGGPAGHMSLDGYSLGGYWTHFGASGWYVDAVVQGTRFDNVVAKSVLNQSIETNGWGLTTSLEGGKPFQLGNFWVIEPQAQIVYQRISLGSTADAFGLVQFGDSDAVRGRLGARLAKSFAISDGTAPRFVTTSITANVWHGFVGDPKTTFANLQGLNAVSLSSNLGGTWAQIQVGLTGQITRNVAVFASADYSASIDSGNSTSVGGRGGIKVAW